MTCHYISVIPEIPDKTVTELDISEKKGHFHFQMKIFQCRRRKKMLIPVKSNAVLALFKNLGVTMGITGMIFYIDTVRMILLIFRAEIFKKMQSHKIFSCNIKNLFYYHLL